MSKYYPHWKRKEETDLCRRNRARRNDVGCDPPRAVFDGDTVRQGIDACLRDGHVGLEGHAAVVDCGADEDDSATCSERRRFD